MILLLFAKPRDKYYLYHIQAEGDAMELIAEGWWVWRAMEAPLRESTPGGLPEKRGLRV